MKINSIRPVSFGKIYVAPEVKEDLYKHSAHGIGEGSVKNFKEKYRLANLSDRFDIKFNEAGAEVIDKKNSDKTPFDLSLYGEYPNPLYHTLNAALNYVLVKESGTFEPEDAFSLHIKNLRKK